MTLHKAYIGIGSNLHGPLQQINKAIRAIERLSDDGKVKQSSIYQSIPLVDETANIETPDKKIVEQPDYLNAVVSINTLLEPLELLDALQSIETEQGRIRTTDRWAARTLDLDILLFDNLMIDHPRLLIPHYGLKQRNFVIYPLADLDVNLALPDGITIKNLMGSCSSKGITKID